MSKTADRLTQQNRCKTRRELHKKQEKQAEQASTTPYEPK